MGKALQKREYEKHSGTGGIYDKWQFDGWNTSPDEKV